MRPIKFRAWDKEMKSYVENGYDFRVDGNGYVYRREWGESIWQRTSTLVIEQSAGVKANGKEIYEGDKVKTKDKGKFVIVFVNGAFRLQDISTELWFCVCNKHNVYGLALEVIGNIHEEQQ